MAQITWRLINYEDNQTHLLRTKYCSVDQIEKNETGGVCGTDGLRGEGLCGKR